MNDNDMKTLVIVEHDNQQLKTSTLSTLTAALQLNVNVDVLIAGYQCQSVLDELSTITTLDQIYYIDKSDFEHQLAEDLVPLIMSIAKSYSAILAPASTFGKNILPAVAAKLNVAQISEITQVISADTFVRPIYAGNALATVKSLDNIKVITVRPSAFQAVPLDGVKGSGANEVQIKTLETSATQNKSFFISENLTVNTRPELSSAKIVVSGGRGLGSKDNFQLLEGLADRLGAAIGASRAAVDAGYISNDFQVGQTGKIVAPELYIAIGISGAIQHLAGMKESQIIVAINKDPDAPIFHVADYGLVADLFEVIPQIDALL